MKMHPNKYNYIENTIHYKQSMSYKIGLLDDVKILMLTEV